MIFRLLALLLLLASTARAEPWTTRDTQLQLSWTVLHTVDWLQTRKIAAQPELYWERNPILGKHPSVDAVDVYMATSLVVNTVVARALPHPYRRYWQTLSIGVSGYCVFINLQLGLP